MGVEVVILAGKVAAAVCAIGGLLWAFWSKAFRPLYREICSTMEIINTELKPNGGDSIRDAITRIDMAIVALEARHRASLEHTGTYYWEGDRNGDITFVSKGLCKESRRTPEQLKGRGWLSLVHPDERDRVAYEWDSCVRDKRDFNRAYRVVLDGEIISVVSIGTAITHPYVGFLGFVGAMQRVEGT